MELNKNQKEIIENVINKFGHKHQIIKAIEELSELQKELCNYLNCEDGDIINYEHIADEIADVAIMNYQLMKIFTKLYSDDFNQLVNDRIEYKIDRINNLYSDIFNQIYFDNKYTF